YFYIQYRRLNRVQPGIDADTLMVVLLLLPVMGDYADALGQHPVMGKKRSAVTKASQVFGRKKGSRTDITDGTGKRSFSVATDVFGAQCLGGVLYDFQSVLPRDLPDRLHVSALTVQVGNHDRNR